LPRRPPTLPPVPGVQATFGRDHEYKRDGAISLLAGVDLLTGKVHALAKDRHHRVPRRARTRKRREISQTA
jgi:hypothetical protein